MGLKTEFLAPWNCKKMLLLRLKLLSLPSRLNPNCFLKVTKYLKMPKTSKMNSRGSTITSLKMSNIGQSTRLESGDSNPGWKHLKREPAVDFQNHKLLTRPTPCSQMLTILTKVALNT